MAVTDISFGYVRGQLIFDGLSLEFARGRVTAVTGPSGCGKSSLLYILGLLIRSDRGEVLLNGRNVSGLADVQRSRIRGRRIGFVFQDFRLDDSRTVEDNVLEPTVYARRRRRPMRARAQQLLDETGVTVPLDRTAAGVSGGQAQRIALCRALLLEPEVILADEPTGNLDPASAEAVLGRLRREASQGCTIVIVTHSPTVVAAADDVVDLMSFLALPTP